MICKCISATFSAQSNTETNSKLKLLVLAIVTATKIVGRRCCTMFSIGGVSPAWHLQPSTGFSLGSQGACVGFMRVCKLGAHTRGLPIGSDLVKVTRLMTRVKR